MSTKTLRIRDINDMTHSWSVKVIVYEKTQPRHSTSSPKRYQRITFMDEDEQKVVATIYGSDINLFRDTFKLYDTYIISNAKVSPLPEKYNKFNYPYQWTINRKTAYQVEVKETISRAIFELHFIPLSNVKNLIGEDSLIDVLAIMIEKKERRTQPLLVKTHIIKEYALINQEQIIVVLTLWNIVAESEGQIIDDVEEIYPIIRATNLAVSPHHGGSLGSTPSTVIVVNPNIPEAENLRTWRQKNMKTIAQAVGAKDYFARTDYLVELPHENISTIADVVAKNMEGKHTVRVQAKVVEPDQKYFYMSCQKCQSGVDADFDYQFTCAACKEYTRATPRAMIQLSVFDGSGSLDVSVFGTHVLDITEITPEKCMNMYNEGTPLPVDQMNRKLSNQFFLMKIRKRERYTRDAVQYQYSVLAMQHKKPGDIVASGHDDGSTKKRISKELFPAESSGIGGAKKHARSEAAKECQSTLAEVTNPVSVLANEVMDETSLV